MFIEKLFFGDFNGDYEQEHRDRFLKVWNRLGWPEIVVHDLAFIYMVTCNDVIWHFTEQLIDTNGSVGDIDESSTLWVILRPKEQAFLRLAFGLYHDHDSLLSNDLFTPAMDYLRMVALRGLILYAYDGGVNSIRVIDNTPLPTEPVRLHFVRK